jgi:hypothetical protein
MFGIDPSKGTKDPTPTPTAGLKVSGYLSPDFITSVSSIVKEGFDVEIEGTLLAAKTDQQGFFEIANIPKDIGTISIKISKPGFLSRNFNDLQIAGNLSLSELDAPISMWAGDITRNGVADGTINMADIVEMAKVFNKVAGDLAYSEGYDLNMDGSINMADIIIIARHFGATTASYPAL